MNEAGRILCGLAMLCGASISHAGLPSCAESIAESYRMPVGALEAIFRIENGRTGIAVRNNDGSFDRGLMQINTFWDKHVAEFGITSDDILNDDCINVAVSAWVLRQELNRFGNWRDAFSAYNAGAGRLHLGRGYAQKVLKAWANLSLLARR